ncbi:pyridoxamine 5'-phosphate oxidase family protein [uncultured Ruegeria sp.]|uniref:HugZ family pyridoxamine 5'-phosphate oxidase n=1 Tax=uncultured Ruegeria sp. TaxID=259304 RepID=UPI002606D02A|nr:pyridoxamine 5'-phosphate oxidase family protein [uncultured Ruegeria sp.]
MTKTDPFQPMDATARSQAKELITDATFAALAVLRPDSLLPSVSRIALATDDAGRPVSLISTLADHTQALRANSSCALLIGEPADKGDPLTHPRLTLHAIARLVPKETPEHNRLRARYLSLRPKAKLYVDFADFSFVHFDVQDGVLNGGFGKAYRLAPDDL